MGDRSETVDGTASSTSTGNESRHTAADFSRTIGGNDSRDVSGNSIIAILNARTESVAGDSSESIGGMSESIVEGTSLATFGDDSTERHSGHRTIVVGNADATRSAALHVEGAVRAYAADIFEAVAVNGLTFLCGTTVVSITPTGISINAQNIALQGQSFDLQSGTVAIAGKTSAGMTSQTVTIAGSASTGVFDSNATLTASQIALKSGSSSGTAPPASTAQVTSVTLVDQNGNPLANQRIIVRTGGATGPERAVVLDKTGSFQTTSTEPFEVCFPDSPTATQE